jgi:S1-C subfamily serine protease
MSRYWRFFVSNGRGGQTCGRLGVTGHDVPLFASLARRLELSQASGVEVWEVEPDSPADHAGIEEDDILLALAGQPTPDLDALNRQLAQTAEGMPVTVLVLRGESKLGRWLVPYPSPDAAHPG